MKVVGKRILVKQTLTDEVSKGGIIIPVDQQPLPYGEVIQVGGNVESDVNGSRLQEGDIILFTELGAIPFGIKKNHVLIEFEDVLAILEKEDLEDVGT